MSVQFCPNCENLLRKKRKDDGKIYYYCSCGYEKLIKFDKKKKMVSKTRKKMVSKTVIIKKSDKIQHPTTAVVCPKCEFGKAEYFQYQTRSADEPATTFYRCLRCGHKWREY
ncbi:MAG: transcription factor S [Promethearchaeota archaeon]